MRLGWGLGWGLGRGHSGLLPLQGCRPLGAARPSSRSPLCATVRCCAGEHSHISGTRFGRRSDCSRAHRIARAERRFRLYFTRKLPDPNARKLPDPNGRLPQWPAPHSGVVCALDSHGLVLGFHRGLISFAELWEEVRVSDWVRRRAGPNPKP